MTSRTLITATFFVSLREPSVPSIGYGGANLSCARPWSSCGAYERWQFFPIDAPAGFWQRPCSWGRSSSMGRSATRPMWRAPISRTLGRGGSRFVGSRGSPADGAWCRSPGLAPRRGAGAHADPPGGPHVASQEWNRTDPGPRRRRAGRGGRLAFPTEPEGAAPFTFAVVGDSGGYPARLAELWGYTPHEGAKHRPEVIVHGMSEARPQLILHAGDVVYPDGERENYVRAFFRPMHRSSRRPPSPRRSETTI